jgi:glycosylphosphatidylinositol transamidase
MGSTGQRLTAYPFLHVGLLHAITNILALTPLLEKFETENGTLVTAIMFTGRKEIVTSVNEGHTNPASFLKLSCYTLHSNQLHSWYQDPGSRREVRKICLPDSNQSLTFVSVWVFLLLSSTVYRASRTTPRISVPLTGQTFPTAAIPLVLILLTSFLIPHTSLIGHCCGAIIGYGWGAGYLDILAPPEKLLRWIEEKLGLRTRLPGCYVSVEKLTYGRYGLSVLPTSTAPNGVLAGP